MSQAQYLSNGLVPIFSGSFRELSKLQLDQTGARLTMHGEVENVLRQVETPAVTFAREWAMKGADERVQRKQEAQLTFWEKYIRLDPAKMAEQKRQREMAAVGWGIAAQLVATTAMWATRRYLNAQERFKIQKFVYSGMQYVAGANEGLTPAQDAAFDLVLEDLAPELKDRQKLFQEAPVDSLQRVESLSNLDEQRAKAFFYPLAHVALVEDFDNRYDYLMRFGQNKLKLKKASMDEVLEVCSNENTWRSDFVQQIVCLYANTAFTLNINLDDVQGYAEMLTCFDPNEERRAANRDILLHVGEFAAEVFTHDLPPGVRQLTEYAGKEVVTALFGPGRNVQEAYQHTQRQLRT